jgi:hypothetical protein
MTEWSELLQHAAEELHTLVSCTSSIIYQRICICQRNIFYLVRFVAAVSMIVLLL